MEVKGISERVAVLKLKLSNAVNLAVTQVYAPTSVSDEREIIEFYELIKDLYNREKEYFTVLMGDWNAIVGKDNTNGTNIGNFCEGSTNESGNRLVEMMSKNNLKLALFRETEVILQKLNKNKIAGPGGMENEILKRGAPSLTQPLTELFNLMEVTGDIPELWGGRGTM